MLYPRHSSSILLTPPLLVYPTLLLLLLPPCAPSLTQGPSVPVCNISKAVRQPSQGKQPSAGFRGDWGPRCFSSGTQGLPEASGWGQGGAKGGRRSPQLPPTRIPTSLFSFFLSISIFCLLSPSPSSLSFFLVLHLCTQQHLHDSFTFTSTLTLYCL